MSSPARFVWQHQNEAAHDELSCILDLELFSSWRHNIHCIYCCRHQLESLFQPLAEALVYHDASESLPLDSALSPRSTSDLDRQLKSATSVPHPAPPLSSTTPSSSNTASSATAVPNGASAQRSNGLSDIAAAEQNQNPSNGQHQEPSSDSSSNLGNGTAQHSGLHSVRDGQDAQAVTTAAVSPFTSNEQTHALTPSHHNPVQDATQQQALVSQPEMLQSSDAADRASQDTQTAVPNGSADHAAARARDATMESLLEIYEDPDAHAGLYNYAKALEDVEAGLLAGFFHKHYCLASNVIGSQSKGMFRVVRVCA